MSTDLPDNAPQPDAVAAQPPVDQSLGDGFTQAPEPTVDDTATATPPPAETHPEFTYEDYRALQEQLNEREDMLAQIRKVAEEQQQQQRDQQFKAELRSRLQNEIKRSVPDIDEDDVPRITEQLFGFLDGTITDVTQTYQSQINQYRDDVQQAFWAATMPGFAEDLIRQHGLPQEVKQDLLQFKTEGEMTTYALRVKAAISQFAQQQQQQAVQQQAQARRDSGVNAVGGVTGGPMPEPGIQPGTARELMPALRSIFGM